MKGALILIVAISNVVYGQGGGLVGPTGTGVTMSQVSNVVAAGTALGATRIMHDGGYSTLIETNGTVVLKTVSNTVSMVVVATNGAAGYNGPAIGTVWQGPIPYDQAVTSGVSEIWIDYIGVISVIMRNGAEQYTFVGSSGSVDWRLPMQLGPDGIDPAVGQFTIDWKVSTNVQYTAAITTNWVVTVGDTVSISHGLITGIQQGGQ